jgi:trk system potassium uptake protein TrkH
MQWIGGLSTIILSLYVISVTKSLNIQLPTNEFSGQTGEKIHPKIVEVAKRLFAVYISLTLIEVLLLVIGRMPFFDAICHSLSTLSAGGFSTRNNGIADFSSPYLRSVITLFMFFAGTNMSLFYYAAKKNYKKITTNNEFLIYLFLASGISILVSAIVFRRTDLSLGLALSDGFFHVVSFLSTTGFYISDYSLWGGFVTILIIILMIIGGMSGSAGSGLRVIRLFIVFKNSRTEMRRLVHPFAYLPVRVDQKTVPPNIVINLLVFISVYCMSICVGSLIMSMMDYDLLTSLSTTISMLGNTGPGIGSSGPFSDFSHVHEITKWFLSGLMMTGRLELLAVLVIFTRSFYKK